jgi:hypothetical protein
MALKIIKKSEQVSSNKKQGSGSGKGHVRPLPITLDLNAPGLLRVGHCLTLFAVSHSSFYRGLGTKYPKPDGDDGRPYWKTETIRNVLTPRDYA